jgi:hypothetical protein
LSSAHIFVPSNIFGPSPALAKKWSFFSALKIKFQSIFLLIFIPCT